MRTYFRIMLLVVILVAIEVGSSQVSAQTCTIHPSSLAYTSSNFYYGYNANGVIVPVSATCPFVGGQLYAVGYAIDPSTNVHVDSSSATLSSAYGTNTYTRQLAFSIPPEVTGHTLQILISIYTGAYYSYGLGTSLTTSVETVQVSPNNNYVNYASCYYNNNCAQVVNSCNSPNSNDTVQCAGYLYQNPNSCVELVIPIVSPIGLVSSQYYTLQELPASYPAIGTWVSVTGQLHQGHNFSSTGAACPGNYLNVTSISS
jgi:hypothetical protein